MLNWLIENISIVISVMSLVIMAIVGLGIFVFKPNISSNQELKNVNESLKDLSDENAKLKDQYKSEFEDVNKRYLTGKKRIDELEKKLNQMIITVERLANFERKYNLLLEWGHKVLHIGDDNDIRLPRLDHEVYYDMKNYKKDEDWK